MKQFQLFLNSVLALIGFCSLQTRAEIPFNQIKALHSVVRPDRVQFSPLNGFTWWKTFFIENLYRYGDNNSSTVRLIKELFYLQYDGITFDATKLARKPATYFKASTIGIIAALLQQYIDDSGHLEKTIREKLITAIKKDIDFDTAVIHAQAKLKTLRPELAVQEEQISKYKKEQAAAIKSAAKPLSPLVVERRAIRKQIKSAEEKNDQEKIKVLKERDAQLTKQIDALEEPIRASGKKVQEIEKGHAYANLKRDIHNQDLQGKSLILLVNLLVDSVKESLATGSLYPPYVTHQILEALLWRKVQDKREYLDYYRHAGDILVAESKAILQPGPAQQAWTAEQFTQEDFEKNKNIKKIDVFFESPQMYELGIYVNYADHIYNGQFPPFVESITSEYVHNGITYTFPDCGERIPWDLINRAIYKNGGFDVQYLINIAAKDGVTIDKKVIDFFEKDNKITELNTERLHNKWNLVISNLPGVQYAKGPGVQYAKGNVCEIDAGLGNLLAVFGQLLFSKNKEYWSATNSQKLTLLSNALSHPDFELSWKQTSGDDLNGRLGFPLTIVFAVKKNGAPLYSFGWALTSNHFVVNVMDSTSRMAGTFMYELTEEFKKKKRKIDLPSMNMMSWWVAGLYEYMMSNFENTPYMLQLLFAHNFRSSKNLSWVFPLLLKKSNINIENLVNTLQGIVHEGPVNNVISTLYVEARNAKDSARKQFFVDQLLTLLNAKGPEAVMWMGVLDLKDTRIYEWVRELLPKLAIPQAKEVALHILGRKITELYPAVREHWSKIAQDAVAKKLVQRMIAEQQITELYDMIDDYMKNIEQIEGPFGFIISNNERGLKDSLAKGNVNIQKDDGLTLFMYAVKLGKSNLVKI